MKRRQARGAGGRYVRNTTENCFGLHVEVCPACRRLSSWPIGSERPATCHACGGPLEPEMPKGPAGQ